MRIKFCKKYILHFVICIGFLSLGAQGFSKTPELTSAQDVHRALFKQIQKLSDYQKNAKVIEYVELSGNSAIEKNRCAKFWSLLNKPKQIEIPTPLFLQTGQSGKIAAADLMYKTALSNRKNTEEEKNNPGQEWQDFFKLRNSEKFAARSSIQIPEDNFFDKKNFYDSLISQTNPLSPEDYEINNPIAVRFKYKPIYLIYKNEIPLRQQQELTLVTMMSREGGALSFVHNGLNYNGSLNFFVYDFYYPFGVYDGMSSFDETTYKELKTQDIFDTRKIPSPSLLNGLTQMDGLLLRWTLKYANVDYQHTLRIFNSYSSRIKMKYIVTIDDTITSNFCSIFFR